jgi:hypothetical protein
MCKLFKLVVLLGIVVVALGYYRDWFDVSATDNSATDQVDVNVRIDKARIKSDARKAREKGLDLRQDFDEWLDDVRDNR